VLDILTQNPEVWKKTIFILTYDENDGYFDHVPPFVAPAPGNPGTGKCSYQTDTTVDYVTAEQAAALKGQPKDPQRVSPIGLGYRVPFVVASPWSRGGWVNSQVFDNTSVLMFLEKFLTKKTGKEIKEENISPWRRMICGDLTSVFRPYRGEKITLPAFVEKKPFVESIYNAQFKKLPSGYVPLTKQEIARINENASSSTLLPQQEKGIRSSCALPYQIYAEGRLGADKKTFEWIMRSENKIFGDRSAGVPFTVYNQEDFSIRNYAVAAGDQLTDQWEIGESGTGRYHFTLYGPNGFFREMQGDAQDPAVNIQCEYEQKRLNRNKLTGNVELKIKNGPDAPSYDIEITDQSYNHKPIVKIVRAGREETILLDLKRSFGWYDFTLKIRGNESFMQRYAGRVETGEPGFSDPAMGRVEV
jgi:phospholipase C